MSDMRMRRELLQAYRDHLEDPYEQLPLQNYVRLLARYKGPENQGFLKNWKKWSGSKIVYDYDIYDVGENRRVFVGANLSPGRSALRRASYSLGSLGDGYSGYYVSDHSGLHGAWASPEFVREDFKKDSVYWTQDASYVLVNSETWPDDRVPGDVSDFFYSPYHGEVNLVSINGRGEIRWAVRPMQITGTWGRAATSSRTTSWSITGDLDAALEFGLVRVDAGDIVEFEVPAP